MGYCARDGSGDGKAHYFPRVDLGPVIPHVADANARLSLTNLGVIVSIAGSSDARGPYFKQPALHNGKAWYAKGLTNDTLLEGAIYWESGSSQWRINNLTGFSYLYRSSDNVSTPDLATTWIDHGGGLPLPTVVDSPGQVTGAGYQVTQDDEGNAIVHTFNNNGADADAGLLVTGAGTTSWIQAYVLNGSRYEPIPDVGFNRIEDAGGGAWTMGTDYAISLPDTYPWSQTWAIVAGDSPAPTVLRNPVASLANWTP